MIISQQKPIDEILASLKEYKKIFLVGCGECSTACKSGGEPEILKMKEDLKAAGKEVSGYCIPSAPCIAAKLKNELAKNIRDLRQADAVLILACGLGVQSFKDNDRMSLAVFSGCNTLFGAVMDAKGNFFEKCSMCGECLINKTAGICPVTLCAKGLLNGPCGGVNQGKCELDSDRDCAWVLIYRELEKNKKLDLIKEICGAKDFNKTLKPHKLTVR
ncbi:MAG: methylenetetrahydrofolate reductase C-terminal domain-containing protein [Candidatus Omnitrophota bacterium]